MMNHPVCIIIYACNQSRYESTDKTYSYMYKSTMNNYMDKSYVVWMKPNIYVLMFRLKVPPKGLFVCSDSSLAVPLLVPVSI